MAHTILLVQAGPRLESRTYSDFESVNECMEGVCKIYEEHLKVKNPNTPTITYDISQLFDFIDQVREFFCCKDKSEIWSKKWNFSWLTSVAWFINAPQIPTPHTTRNGSRRKFMSSYDKPQVPIKQEWSIFYCKNPQTHTHTHILSCQSSTIKTVIWMTERV